MLTVKRAPKVRFHRVQILPLVCSDTLDDFLSTTFLDVKEESSLTSFQCVSISVRQNRLSFVNKEFHFVLPLFLPPSGISPFPSTIESLSQSTHVKNGHKTLKAKVPRHVVTPSINTKFKTVHSING